MEEIERFCQNVNCIKNNDNKPKKLLKYQKRCCSNECHNEWKKQNNIPNPWSNTKGKTFEEIYGIERTKIIKDKLRKSLKSIVKSEQWIANAREGCIRYRKKHGIGSNTPNVGYWETDLLNIQELIDKCEIQRQYYVKGLGYFVDGYCPETNTVYEIYEKFHLYNKKLQKDLIRQNQIEKKLNCNFVIIRCDHLKREKIMSAADIITGYEKEDIIKVIQRIVEETKFNREMSVKLYNHMENAMLNNKGDLVVLSQMADRYLEQASRQADILVKLAQVMQKLRQTEDEANKDDPKEKQSKTDYTKILSELDLITKSPFIRKVNKPVTLSDLSIAAEIPKQIDQPPKTLNEGDIELETDL